MSVSGTPKVLPGSIFGSSASEAQTPYAAKLKRDLDLYQFEDPSELPEAQQRRLLPDEVGVLLDEIFLPPLSFDRILRAPKGTEAASVPKARVQFNFCYSQFLEDLFQALSEYRVLEAMNLKGGKSGKVLSGREGTAWDYDLFLKIKDPKSWKEIEAIVLGCIAKQARIIYKDDEIGNIRRYYQNGQLIGERSPIPKASPPIEHWKREGVCGLILKHGGVNFCVIEKTKQRQHFICSISAGGKKFDIHVASQLEHEAFCSSNCIQIPLLPLFVLLRTQGKDFPRDKERLLRFPGRLAECLHIISTDGYSLREAELAMAGNSFSIYPPEGARTLRKGLLIYLRFLTKMKKCWTPGLMPYLIEGFIAQYYEKEKVESKRGDKNRLIFNVADFERDLRGEAGHFQDVRSKITYLLNIEDALMNSEDATEKDKIRMVISNLLVEYLGGKRLPPEQVHDFIEFCKVHLYLFSEQYRRGEAQRTAKHLSLQLSPLLTGFPSAAILHFLNVLPKVDFQKDPLYPRLVELFPLWERSAPSEYPKELARFFKDLKTEDLDASSFAPLSSCSRYLDYKGMLSKFESLERRQQHLIYLLLYKNETLQSLDQTALLHFQQMAVKFLFPLIEKGNKRALIAYLSLLKNLHLKAGINPKLIQDTTHALLQLPYIASLPGFRQILEVHTFLYTKEQSDGRVSQEIPFASIAHLLAHREECRALYPMLLDVMPLDDSPQMEVGITRCFTDYNPDELSRMKSSPLRSLSAFMKFSCLLEHMPPEKVAKLILFIIKNRVRSMPSLGSKERSDFENLIAATLKREPLCKDKKAKAQLLESIEVTPSSCLFFLSIESGVRKSFYAGIKHLEKGSNPQLLEALCRSDASKTPEGQRALARFLNPVEVLSTQRASSSSLTSLSDPVSGDDSSARSSPVPDEKEPRRDSSPIVFSAAAASLSLTEVTERESSSPIFFEGPSQVSIQESGEQELGPLDPIDRLREELEGFKALDPNDSSQCAILNEKLTLFYEKIVRVLPSCPIPIDDVEREAFFDVVQTLSSLLYNLKEKVNNIHQAQIAATYIVLIYAHVHSFASKERDDLKKDIDLKIRATMLHEYFKLISSLVNPNTPVKVQQHMVETWICMIECLLEYPDAVKTIQEKILAHLISHKDNLFFLSKLYERLLAIVFRKFKETKNIQYLEYVKTLIEVNIAKLSSFLTKEQTQAFFLQAIIMLESLTKMIKPDETIRGVCKEILQWFCNSLEKGSQAAELQCFATHVKRAVQNAQEVLAPTKKDRAEALYDKAFHLHSVAMEIQGDSLEIVHEAKAKWGLAFMDICEAINLNQGQRKYYELLCTLNEKVRQNIITSKILIVAIGLFRNDVLLIQNLATLVKDIPGSSKMGPQVLCKLEDKDQKQKLDESTSILQKTSKDQILAKMAKIKLDEEASVLSANDSFGGFSSALILYCRSVDIDIVKAIDEINLFLQAEETRTTEYLQSLEDGKKTIPPGLRVYLKNIKTLRLKIFCLSAEKFPSEEFTLERLNIAYDLNQEVLAPGQKDTAEWRIILRLFLLNKERCAALTHHFEICQTASSDLELVQLRIEVLTAIFKHFYENGQVFLFEAFLVHLEALLKVASAEPAIITLYQSAVNVLKKVLSLDQPTIQSLKDGILALSKILWGNSYSEKRQLFTSQSTVNENLLLDSLLLKAGFSFEAPKAESKSSKKKKKKKKKAAKA